MNGQGTAQKMDARQRALQEELRELIDVVGPAQIVDMILERAFQIRATDIHLDPNEDGLRVRLRVDGMLHDILQVPPSISLQMVSRAKLLAGMNIAEKRLSQDGHISQNVGGISRDIRVGSGPTIFGERLVLRLMPDRSSFTKLDELGLDPEQIKHLRHYITHPYGMVLSVGPVGSGKSTTMYSCLEMLNEPHKSVVTIEDPVERRIPGVNQIQVDSRIDFTFVQALRGVLRQDPNVMMIGEIRDPETAHIGIRAGQTGVLVLSTLHANDAASCIDVFRDFGVPSMFIADSVQAVISQRLLRKVCQSCKTAFNPDEPTCQVLGIDPQTAQGVELYRGKGCDACFNTGYSGRIGVFELLGLDEELKHEILTGAPRSDILKLAISKGMRTLQQTATRKVLDGMTTVEEMHRVMLADYST
jgi:type II secretory ATPase GspE/PulE/Tfp pilus assembly ATPase PilB-like protein